MNMTDMILRKEEVREFGAMLADLKNANLVQRLRGLEEVQQSTAAELNRLQKRHLTAMLGSGSAVRWVGDVPFVSDDCAHALTAVAVAQIAQAGQLERLVRDSAARERIFAHACGILQMETRAALTGTEIPLPTVYVPQIVELVWKYGQARQYATVFPLGAGTVKMPRLKAGEDDFGYFGAGTAGMSQTVTEKKVAAELVTFTANKGGGLIRIPYELEEDTFVPIGQFLARYIARQLAKLEDKTLFLADGTATYAGQSGIGPYCAANPTYLLQLGAGKTKPSDATLADFRNLRAKVSQAILAGGLDGAYYLSATFEPALRAFNQYPNFVIFTNENGKSTLDGWPVRWIGVSQAYGATAAPSAYLAFFGALNYWFLGERGVPRVEFSRDVFFATDELALRALERIDVECLGIDSMAALQTAAA